MAASGELGEAVALFNAGRLAEALTRARTQVAANPRDAAAYSLCAAIHARQGNPEAAAADLRRALKIEPRNAPMLNNLGFVLRTLGETGEAADAFRAALRERPDYPEAHNNLALALLDIDQPEQAAESARRAIALKPGYADAHNNLGNALRRLGDGEAAAESYRAALAISHNHAGYHANLARVLADLGRPGQAAESYRHVVRLKPTDADARFRLGAALVQTGDSIAAEESLRSAIAAKPDHAWAHFLLGEMLDDLGRGQEGFTHILDAATLDPDNPAFAQRLAVVIAHIRFEGYEPRAVAAIERLLTAKTIARAQELMRPLLGLLRARPLFTEALTRGEDISESVEFVCAALRGSPPFLLAASVTPIADPQIENLLTRLRRAMLLQRRSLLANADAFAVLVSLALHCFANEYVFFEDGTEQAEVAALEHELSQASAQGALEPFLVACLAVYRPLDDYNWARQIAPPAGLEELFQRQIHEPAQERRLREATPQLRPIADEMSKKVQDQYEQNPYPRWINTALAPVGASIREIAKARGLKIDVAAFAARPDVLVAGCGTGQHALSAASSYLGSNVFAIDLSRASLARAQRKAVELGVKNVTFMQADILDLELTGRTFDVIECVGTLFHMADPVAGWRSLKGRLKPHGIMRIGLYSDCARAGVWAARSLIEERGLTAGALDDIRAFRHAVLSGEIGSFDGRDEVIASPEFYSTSECRDLLFHVNEITFTIERLKRDLETLGLRFLGFELPAGALRVAFEAEYGADRLCDLDAWQAFEEAHPQTFARMYVFWCALRPTQGAP